jgi:hypothetical protein
VRWRCVLTPLRAACVWQLSNRATMLQAVQGIDLGADVGARTRWHALRALHCALRREPSVRCEP